MRKIKYRSFTKARDYARSLNLDTFDDWRKHAKSSKLPDDIPSAPNTVYKNQYKGVGDWLGTGRVADKYKTWRKFKETKRFALSLNLQSFEEWKKYCKSGKKPDDIPDIPSNIYKNKGWKGWPDFLGNKRVVKYTENNTRPFEECKKFVRSLGIKTGSDWFRWCKKNERPDDIPYSPDEVYKEWTTWRDFLGPLPERWKSFEDARAYAQSLNLKSPREWSQLSKSKKRSNDIPSNPFQVYRNKGWKGWSDFLGTGNLTTQQLHAQYYSYSDAKKYVQKQGIKTYTEFTKWSSEGKRPIFITASPEKFYKEWTDWYNFLGTKKIVNRSFEDARRYVQSLNLKFNSDWLKLHKEGKIPKDIPRYVNETYADKWEGWGDFLGTGNLSPSDTKQNYKSFKDARKFVRSLGVKTEPQWREWNRKNKRPAGIPYAPEAAYPNEWTSMGDWFGTDSISSTILSQSYLSPQKAKPIIQKLAKKYGLKNKADWTRFAKTHKKLLQKLHLPADPLTVYSLKRAEKRIKK